METRTPEFVLQVDKKVLSTIVDIARAKETYFPPKTSISHVKRFKIVRQDFNDQFHPTHIGVYILLGSLFWAGR